MRGWTLYALLSMKSENTFSEAVMRFQRIIFIAAVMLLICGLCNAISSEDKAPQIANNPIGHVPGMFLHQLTALGKRLKVSGNEKTVYSGQLFDKAGNSSHARIVHQLPGLIKLEGFKGQGSVLSFDGQRARGITSRKSDEALLEIFSIDYPEGMFISLQQGAALRVIGRGFGPDPRIEPDYKGPRYDIFEVTNSVASRQDQSVRSKLYYFDSQTGLLQSTRYYDRSVSPPVKMETRFSGWGTIDGSAYPAKIEHYEGGKLVFTFIAESIEGGVPMDKSNY
jgi:hypothetical protein